MGSIKETALNYESEGKIKNISELASVDINFSIIDEKESQYPYQYIEVNEIRYKVPKSVLIQLKSLLEDNSDLKKFKVKKSGEGMDAKYLVIPLFK